MLGPKSNFPRESKLTSELQFTLRLLLALVRCIYFEVKAGKERLKVKRLAK